MYRIKYWEKPSSDNVTFSKHMYTDMHCRGDLISKSSYHPQISLGWFFQVFPALALSPSPEARQVQTWRGRVQLLISWRLPKPFPDLTVSRTCRRQQRTALKSPQMWWDLYPLPAGMSSAPWNPRPAARYPSQLTDLRVCLLEAPRPLCQVCHLSLAPCLCHEDHLPQSLVKPHQTPKMPVLPMMQ